MLASTLFALSLGPWGLLGVACTFLTFVLGGLCLLAGLTLSLNGLDKSGRGYRVKNILLRPLVFEFEFDHDQDQDQTVWSKERPLTGLHHVDEPLTSLLSYVFRDYIYPWHVKLTHQRSFPQQLEATLQHAVASLASKIRSVDWVPFLTTRLVDDVASHVRLFKKARNQLKASKRVETGGGGGGKVVDLESLFFDAEAAMEANQCCRDLASSIQQEELTYLQSLADLLLFLLLPEQDFNAAPLKSLTREVLVNVVLKPGLDHLSDPDFVNQTLVWLHGEDTRLRHEVFVASIRYSEHVEELLAARESVNKEVSFLRSNDSKAEMDSSLKQQLNSLLYLRNVIDTRIHRLQGGSDSDSIGLPAHVDWNQMVGPGLKLFDLPLDVILKNNVALSYFIDYMTSIGCQAYLFFYLNAEGWKVSAETQIQAIEVGQLKSVESGGLDLDSTTNCRRLSDNMREAAHSIYEEYLSEKANPRLKVDETVVKRLLFKVRTEPPDPEWFDECQECVHQRLRSDESFMEAFKKSMGYVKLLAELDLLKDDLEEDEDDLDEVSDELSIYDRCSVHSTDSLSSLDRDGLRVPKSHQRTGSNVSSASSTSGGQNWPRSCDLTRSISAQVLDVSIVREGVVKPFAMYTILVKVGGEGDMEMECVVRKVLRRYSDFYALHEKVCAKYPSLSKLAFPSKKTFGNMDKNVLDKRRLMLDSYLKELLRPETLQNHCELVIYLERFLDDTASYESERNNSLNVLLKAHVGSVRNSVKTAAHAVTSVPNNLFNTVDNVMDGLTKALQIKHGGGPALIADGKVGASLDAETSDNIPMRILLLFMDEVFDLRERNQWLRRQIVAVLRQLIKAMFGDIVNRRIVDYFAQMTSPETLGSYLQSFKQSLWPDGYPAAPGQPRDENTKMRTRIVARSALFSSFSDDLRRVIGSETSRSGLMMLFDMLQHPVLNKRLAIVLLEGIIETLFHEQEFGTIFQKLHSRSSRVKNELKNSQRKYVDLRR